MGAQPFIGRTYREADSNVGRVVVLRHDIWDTVFGRDPEVVGQTVRLNDEPYVVVGVMPPEFTAVGAGLWTPSEGRVPAPPVEVKGDIASNRRLSYLRLIGRLRPSVSLSGAQADADRIGEHLKDALASRGENFGLLVEPYVDVFGRFTESEPGDEASFAIARRNDDLLRSAAERGHHFFSQLAHARTVRVVGLT